MQWSYLKAFRYTLIAFAVIAAVTAQGQQIDAYMSIGYAGYSHPEFREYQKYQVRSSGVDARVIDAFPNYYTFGGGVSYSWVRFILGLELGHGSTGGRVYYEDYSGKLTEDITITYNYLAVHPSFFIHRAHALQVLGGLKLLAIGSTAKINNTLVVGNSTLNEQADFGGVNLGIQPNVTAKKYFGRLLLQASLGYELQNSAYPVTQDEDSLFLDNGSGEPVHLKGSGFRASVGVGFRIELW